MNIVPNTFVQIHEDCMLATGRDVAMAAVIAVIERLSNINTGGPGGWVSVSAQEISRLSCWIVAKKTVSKKVSQLKELQLIEVELDNGRTPLFRVKRENIIKMAGKTRSYRTQDSLLHPPLAKEHNGIYREPAAEFEPQNPPPVKEGYLLNPPTVEDGLSVDPPPAAPQPSSGKGGLSYIYIEKEKEEEVNINTLVIETVENPSFPLRGRETSNTENSEKAVDTDKTRKQEEQENKNESGNLAPLKEKTNDHGNTEVSTKTESIQNEEKENTMNEDVRAVLKSYDKIPKNKRDKNSRGSILSLYRQHGDVIEKLVNEQGLEEILSALEDFKRDSYCGDKGFPLRLFAYRARNYSKNTNQNHGGNYGVGNEEKIAPRAVSVQISTIQQAEARPTEEELWRAMKRKKNRRKMAIESMLRQVLPETVEGFLLEASNLDAMTPERIEHWYKIASAKWHEVRGPYEPTGGTTPLC